MKRKQERIACACFVTSEVPLLTVTPIPTNMLPMDYWNKMKKEGIAIVKIDPHFITTHGNVVDAKEAFIVAVEANQIETTRIKGKLCATDLWSK